MLRFTLALLLLGVSNAIIPKWRPQPELGLVAYLKDGSEVPVPQTKMDIQVKLTANVASSVIKLDYHNPSTHTDLVVRFKFPVDVDTALYNFQAKYDDGTSITLKTEELEAAKEKFKIAKDLGNYAVLANYDEQNFDILRLALSNLKAGRRCTITLQTVQKLHIISPINPSKNIGGYIKYKFATSMFSRYKLCPHENIKHKECGRINRNHYSKYTNFREDLLVHPEFTFELTNALNTELGDRDFSNWIINRSGNAQNKHVVKRRKCGPREDCQWRYTVSDTTKPYSKDGDIVLYLPISEQVVNSYQNKVSIEQDGITMYSHYISTSVLEAYGKNTRNENTEYIFIIDNSDSMSYEVYGTWEEGVIMEKGQRIANAKLALEQIINNLPETGTVWFNIIKFGCEYEILFKRGSVKLDRANKAQAMAFIKAMDSNMACTEILKPIEKATTSPSIPQIQNGRKKQLFVITDGDVSNQTRIFDYIRYKNNEIRVFSVGIGAGASSALVKGMAEAGKGYSGFITETKENSDILTARSMADTVSRSLLAAAKTQVTNILLNGEKFPAFVDNVVTSGKFLTLFSGDTSSRRYRRQTNGLELSYDIVDPDGNAQHQRFSFTNTRRTRGAYLHKGALKSMEAKLELRRLMNEWFEARVDHNKNFGDKWATQYNNGKRYTFEETQASRAKKAEIVEYSKQTGVLSPFTAFYGEKRNTGRRGNVVEVSISSEIQPPPQSVRNIAYMHWDVLSAQNSCSSSTVKVQLSDQGLSSQTISQMKKCGNWPVSAARKGFGSDWNKRTKLVKTARQQKCKSPDEVAATLYHIVYAAHQFPDNRALFRVPTKDAIEYMQNNGCKGIYPLVNQAIKDYQKWNGNSWAKEVKVNPLDIIAQNYQTVTNAQNVNTHTWSREFVTNILGITPKDMKKIDNWCMKNKHAKKGGRKRQNTCKADVPTFFAIYFLYSQFPDQIEDWRLSARLGLSGMKYTDNSLNIAKQVYKVMNNPAVQPIEILMTNTY